MKALTIRQPYVTAITLGFKLCETRPMQTHYRGTLAIHSASYTEMDYLGVIRNAPEAQQQAIIAEGYQVDGKPSMIMMPTGAIIALVEIIDCVELTRVEERYPAIFAATRNEKHWGDYKFGRWGWILSNVRRLAKPIEIRGQQGLWNWTPPAGLKLAA